MSGDHNMYCSANDKQEPVGYFYMKSCFDIQDCSEQMKRNGVPLYTEPQYRELNYYELGELYVQAEKESLRMARVKPDGGISLRPDLVRFAELVLKKARVV